MSKLPCLISASEGALATASPVACHMPGGGLDSRIFKDALRSLPEALDEPRERVWPGGETGLIGGFGEDSGVGDELS